MKDALDHAALKTKQRAIRAGFPETMGLRAHRAISWIGRAEACGDDDDARFIFLWIAFNAAYADERVFQTVAPVSAISTLGTVWRDCVAEGLRLIFIPVGVEDDEEPKDRASETRDDQSPCRASREEHPACDAQVAFF